MNQENVIIRLQKIFNSVFWKSFVLTPNTNIRKDVPGWDWADETLFVTAIEDTFKIRFRVGEIEDKKNIGEIADLIINRFHEANL